MDEFLLIVAFKDQLPLLKEKKFEVLDSNFSRNIYYLVRPRTVEELTSYGEIIYTHKNDCVIKVLGSGERRLWKSGFRLKRLGKTIKIRPLPEKIEGTGLFFGKDPRIVDMVAKVDSLNYLGYVQRLQNFKTRFSLTDSCKKAAEYLWSLYDGFGLSPVYQEFIDGLAPNVIATKTGISEPEVEVIVCGHFDATIFSQFGDPDTVAPGADDNGSGSAGAVEIARILKDYQFERTVKFINFAGEEQGLLGSGSYADSVAHIRDSIIGVFNLDMIGHVSGPESLLVIGDAGSVGLVDTFINYASVYVQDLKTERTIGYFPYSDHASFEDQGYPAILGIELAIERGKNPYYHTPGDTIGSGFNSLSFATKALKAVVAAVAELAIPSGTPVEEQSQPVLSRLSLGVEPDPNSGRFSVAYSLPERSKLNIELYNAAGQRVLRLFNGEGNAGENRLTFDRRTLATGVYFLAMRGNGFFLTRRFACVN